MTCPKCQHTTSKRFGYYGKTRVPRYRCKDCGATFSEAQPPRTPINGHTTEFARILQVFTLLTEGMSVRAISRVTGVHKTTILALLNTIGNRCAALLDAKVQNLKPRYVQADEAWTFVHTKQKRLTSMSPVEWGDQYVWLALDSDAKLIMSYRVGKRDAVNAYEFIGDLNRRIAERHRCHLTTDGLDGYVPAVEEHFGADVDFAQLVKQYAAPRTMVPTGSGRPRTSSRRFQLPSPGIRRWRRSARRTSSART